MSKSTLVQTEKQSPTYSYRDNEDEIAFMMFGDEDEGDILCVACTSLPEKREFPLYADDLEGLRNLEPILCGVCNKELAAALGPTTGQAPEHTYTGNCNLVYGCTHNPWGAAGEGNCVECPPCPACSGISRDAVAALEGMGASPEMTTALIGVCPNCFATIDDLPCPACNKEAVQPDAASWSATKQCPECSGSGTVCYGATETKCTTCDGRGWVGKGAVGQPLRPTSGHDPSCCCSRCEHFNRLKGEQPAESAKPVDMLLLCPRCGVQHVDAPDERTPDWKNPPHKTHLCHECGHLFRPSDQPTNGVAVITSKTLEGAGYAQVTEQPTPVVFSDDDADDKAREILSRYTEAVNFSEYLIPLTLDVAQTLRQRLATPVQDMIAGEEGKAAPTELERLVLAESECDDPLDALDGDWLSYKRLMDVVQQAWPTPQGYAQDPLELVVRIIDERDEAIGLNKLASVDPSSLSAEKCCEILNQDAFGGTANWTASLHGTVLYTTEGNHPRSIVHPFYLHESQIICAYLSHDTEVKGEILPAIMALAHAMQFKIDKNAHKGGWQTYDDNGVRIWNGSMLEFLKSKLIEEVEELFAEVPNGEKEAIRFEAADVANLAMMIADACGALSHGAVEEVK